MIYGRAAAKIARVLGHNFGPKEYGASRYVKPTMKIDGDRIVRIIPW